MGKQKNAPKTISVESCQTQEQSAPGLTHPDHKMYVCAYNGYSTFLVKCIFFVSNTNIILIHVVGGVSNFNLVDHDFVLLLCNNIASMSPYRVYLYKQITITNKLAIIWLKKYIKIVLLFLHHN